MARKRRTDNEDDPQGQPAPASAGASGRASGGRSSRARPGPQARTAKAGSVTKSVQQGRASRFVQECVAELKKVTWPTRPQLLQATMVVIVAVAIIAAFLGVADQISEWIVDRVF
jgi:preprotein translocase subunit SecE